MMSRRASNRASQPAQRGYVLLFVMAALTVVAIVAGRFAARIDSLRERALNMQQYADARLHVASAKAQALYWLSTRPMGFSSVGFADEQPLVLDGRSYRMESGAIVRAQDERGLLSVNVPDRDAMVTVLIQSGASLSDATAAIDVLEDYADIDSLRRLNGAEASDYAALGLPPPRNDWILSPEETARMPVWQRMPEVRAKVTGWLGVRRNKLFNPNTAPMALLRAMYPRVDPAQWDVFETLRRRAPFASAEAAIAATGIPFVGDNLLFHASNTLRMTLWAPGLPQSLEYNLLILPSGATAPWLIHEVRLSPGLVHLNPSNAAASASVSSPEPFPVPSEGLAARSREAAQPAP